jgi:Acetyltransferase (GNAT) domain
VHYRHLTGLSLGFVVAAILGLLLGPGYRAIVESLKGELEASHVMRRLNTTRPRRLPGEPLRIGGRELVIKRRLVRIVRIKEEWHQDIDDPEAFVETMRRTSLNADLFSFWQRPTDPQPKYSYYREPEPVSVLPIKGYRYWLEHQLGKSTRQAIRRAQRRGVEVRIVDLDDAFVRGIAAIYNETPVRQGRPFPHHHKVLEDVRRLHEPYRDESEFFGAYYRGELIGFMKLTYRENYVDTMQLISKIAHRDKSPSNALMAKAVERCASRNMPYLCYGEWSRGGLGAFKRHNGFERLDLPRYYIPLTMKGRLALKSGLHRDVVKLMPESMVRLLSALRRRWHAGRKVQNTR